MVEVHVERDFMSKGVRVWAWDRRGDEVSVLRFERGAWRDTPPIGPGTMLPDEPSFFLTESMASELLAGLKGAGVREPERDKFLGALEGKLQATEAHLADMRRLVFLGNEEE